jgi:hypothetical protein
MNRFNIITLLATLCFSTAAAEEKCDSDFCGPEFRTSLAIVVMVTFIIVFSVFMENCVMGT